MEDPEHYTSKPQALITMSDPTRAFSTDLPRKLAYNRRPLDEFDARAQADASLKQVPLDANDRRVHPRGFQWDRLHLHGFEWDRQYNHGVGRYLAGEISASDLVKSKPQVRVLFAPRCQPTADRAAGLREVFNHFTVPTAFIDEANRGVSQSFGTYEDPDGGTEYIWFHLLSKNFTGNAHPGTTKQEHFSKDTLTWMKPGFVLKVERAKGEGPATQTSQVADGNSDATFSNNSILSVTLLCFGVPLSSQPTGAPTSFYSSFDGLARDATAEEILHDPYVLVRIVFEEMFKIMDDVGWFIADVFGETEKEVLGKASTPVQAGKNVNFTMLHYLMKHTIYIRETCDSALSTLECFLAYRDERIGIAPPTPLQRSTRNALRYQKTLLQSTQVRLLSLDKRMTNVLQLSFHLVTQRDSRLQQSEALSMKTIAVVTLLFMPLGTVAAIFGTQLISMGDGEAHRIVVSQDFWILWLVAVPVTVIVVVIWRVWYWDERAQLTDEVLVRESADSGYLGWDRFGGNVWGKTRHKERRGEKGRGAA